ncbi:MAG: class I SAM-dependent methyltransferase [Rickettsiales bacterium]|nr:class I SAM-dependent methyltransferase [Rickettsiales bacterium]
MINEILFNRRWLSSRLAKIIKNFDNYDFLYNQIADNIFEDTKTFKESYSNILEINIKNQYLLEKFLTLPEKLQPKNIIQTSICNNPQLIKDKLITSCKDSQKIILENKINHQLIIAEEEIMPFGSNILDLIISNSNLHFINDLPKFLLQINNILVNKGLFIASFFGEDNLSELARAILETENNIYDGLSPRMIPTIQLKTIAHLMAKIGFINVVAKIDKIAVDYKSTLQLLKDLQMMGQSNIISKKSRRFFTKYFLTKLIDKYQEHYSNQEGKIIATFEIITVTGFKP